MFYRIGQAKRGLGRAGLSGPSGQLSQESSTSTDGQALTLEAPSPFGQTALYF